jgi:hypothetical protein
LTTSLYFYNISTKNSQAFLRQFVTGKGNKTAQIPGMIGVGGQTAARKSDLFFWDVFVGTAG